jgi:hypothetical protein
VEPPSPLPGGRPPRQQSRHLSPLRFAFGARREDHEPIAVVPPAVDHGVVSRILRVQLVGEEAKLGRIPAADVARLLLATERVLARAAGEALGRRVKPTGRWAGIIADSVRLRLVAVEAGSVTGVLELPDLSPEPDQLPLAEAATLSELAAHALRSTLQGKDSSNRDTARALIRMADEVGIGSRYEAITFDADIEATPARLDLETRHRLQSLIEGAQLPTQPDAVAGVLVEADFESDTARLRTPTGQRVAVSFDDDLADAIQEALRRPAELVGEVTYDEAEARATAVRLREITRADQLALGLEPGEFWRYQTVEQLAREQAVQPITDIGVLRDDEASDEEIDAFLAALGD